MRFYTTDEFWANISLRQYSGKRKLKLFLMFDQRPVKYRLCVETKVGMNNRTIARFDISPDFSFEQLTDVINSIVSTDQIISPMFINALISRVSEGTEVQSAIQGLGEQMIAKLWTHRSSMKIETVDLELLQQRVDVIRQSGKPMPINLLWDVFSIK